MGPSYQKPNATDPEEESKAPELRLWTAECGRKDSRQTPKTGVDGTGCRFLEKRIKGSASEKNREFTDTL